MPILEAIIKLQHKAWALVLVTVGFLTLTAILVAEQAISRSFSKLEAERATLEGERGRRLLNQQMQGLTATLKDYAYWSDTVQYIDGEKPGFLEENFTTDNMSSLRMTQVLLLDVQGRPVGSVEMTAEPALQPLSNNRIRMFMELAAPVLADASGEAVLETYKIDRGDLYLISIVSVRMNSTPGTPAKGAVVMARRFDQSELMRFSDILMQPVLLSFDGLDHHGRDDLHMVVVNEHKIESHAPVRDASGRSVADLILTMDRDLHAEGRSLAWAAGGGVAVAGLLLGAALVMLLNRLLLRRLQRLHQDLEALSDNEVLGESQVRIEGNDELTTVGRAINRLLQRVRQDAEEQKAAAARQESLQQQLWQSQKVEALGRFTGGIAHDFNNSLAAITGWMRLADEDLDPAHPSHESLQQALKATRYADGLMRQLLAFSRQAAPRLERLSLCQLVEDSRGLVASGLTKRTTLDVTCSSESGWVQADRTQIQQVLVNLLMNASDAMNGEGATRLTVGVVQLPVAPGHPALPEAAALPPGRYVCLTVQDEGPGIAPENLDRVFDPFFTTKSVGRGTGLGLSVVHGILARHGGAIGVRSTLGEGAAFSILLPACDKAVASRPAEVQGTSPTVRTMLFVDDDQLVRHAWGTLLERKGWEVTRARDGEEGWEIFSRSETRWDIVLTDLAMPRLDGQGLARRIRATEAPPPIVLMSGNVSADDAALLVKGDFAAVLHKPVDAAELDRLLQQALMPAVIVESVA
jgi:two-component system, cell cycle sensor histidine kinase and response regulator CckA